MAQAAGPHGLVSPAFLLPLTQPVARPQVGQSSPVAVLSATSTGAPEQLIASTIAGTALLLHRLVGRTNTRTARRAAAAEEETATEEAPAPEQVSALRRKKKRPPPPKFDPAKEVGALPPLGFFDPLGFCKDADAREFGELREAELKHGRVAMMATVGFIVQHFIHLDVVPSAIRVQTSPYGLGAWTVFYGPPGFFALTGFMFFAGVVETVLWRPEAGPGNFGDPLGIGMYTEDMRNKELNNGRFAMFAVLGICAAEIATGKDAVQQLGF